MKVKLSTHGSWRHQYHIVWIPKYRRNVLKLGVKTYVARGIEEIVTYHPEIEIIKYNIQMDPHGRKPVGIHLIKMSIRQLVKYLTPILQISDILKSTKALG